MDYSRKYGYVPDSEEIGRSLENIHSGIDNFFTEDVLRKCFSFMDLTTLKPQDTVSRVEAFVEKVGRFAKEYPSYPLPASICVYPNFAAVVAENRCSEEVHVTTVSACFPSSQSFAEVKVRECELAVENGAEEVDIVLALNLFLDGNSRGAYDEICAIRAAVDKTAASRGRKVILKVILETGVLATPELIAEASFLAMEAGADFIKTSTGKVDVNATPASAYVMCRCIEKYFRQTGRKVGFKAAGGISNAKDAVVYYAIVDTVLGNEWLVKDLFRLGVSRLGNSLVSAIEQKTVNFF